MSYFVVYSVMGESRIDEFPILEGAKTDFAEKKRLDGLQFFDDRFVVGIEDHAGQRVSIQRAAA
ncbi:hypothetical protein [Shinella sp.]|uniref:hypothetical protein n=1 Tax=Shinella sp. TaxID=1870904 RepID=UPI004035F8D5